MLMQLALESGGRAQKSTVRTSLAECALPATQFRQNQASGGKHPLRNTISIFRVSLASISLSRLSIQSPEAGVAVVTVARESILA